MIRASVAFMLAVASVGPGDEPVRDVFIGTLTVEQGGAILRRCDLAQTRYRLHDAKGGEAVAAFIRDGRPAYGEVVASYVEEDGQPALEVAAIDGLAPGKDCHLLDAIKTLTAGQK